PTYNYTLSLHDALPILLEKDTVKTTAHIAMAGIYFRQKNYAKALEHYLGAKNSELEIIANANIMECYYQLKQYALAEEQAWFILDRKSTRLNSSHGSIS